MLNNMTEKDMYRFFASRKEEIPDDGFSQRVIENLPRRDSALPQIIVLIFLAAGLACTVAIQGVMPFFEQFQALMLSIVRLEIPSVSSIAAYLIGLLSLGSVGYALNQACS